MNIKQILRALFKWRKGISWSWDINWTGHKEPVKDHSKKICYVWTKSGILKMIILNGRSGKTQEQLKDEIMRRKEK